MRSVPSYQAEVDDATDVVGWRYFTPRGWLALALACSAFTVLVFLTQTSILEAFDFVRFHELLKAYGAHALRSGRLPLWNPHVGLGRPFLADIETALFYPPGLLFVALGPGAGFLALTALHLGLAVAGVAFLASHLGASKSMAVTAGFVFVASAPVMLSFYSGQVNYSLALCWLPMVLWLALRMQDVPTLARTAWLALALAMQILAGHPQAAWLTVVATAALLPARRLERPWLARTTSAVTDLLRFGAATAVAMLVCAAQLLPYLELVGQGNRQTPTLAFANHFSMPLAAWATLILQVSPGHGIISVYYVYTGVLALLAGSTGFFCLRGGNRRALWAVALLGFLVSAGTQTPAFGLLFRALPGLSALRIHARMNVLCTLALTLAAAVQLSKRGDSRRATVVLALALVAASSAAIYGHRFVQLGAIGVAGALLASWLSPGVSHRRNRFLAISLAGFALLDASIAIRTMQTTWAQQPSDFRVEMEVAGALRSAGLLAPHLPPPRIFAAPTREDAGMLFGWGSYDSYGSLALARTWEYLHAAAGVAPPELDNTYPAPGVYAKDPFSYRTMNVIAALDPRRRTMMRNPTPDPRAYLVGRTRLVADWKAALAQMAAGHDAARVALVESQQVVLSSSSDASPGTAVIRDFAPERIDLEVQCDGPALLVIKEAWYPGWTATVNGQPAPCQPANVWMRAVPVPAGHSQVVLQFHSTWLRLGVLLSLLGLSLLLVALSHRRLARVLGTRGLGRGSADRPSREGQPSC